jgi:predicted N-formylglutamate amidohydrolase
MIIITCDHGGNLIPPEYQAEFKTAKAVLKTHRGWDPGALDFGNFLSDAFEASYFYSTTSRLLIDLNRSLNNPTLFSEWSKPYPVDVKANIIEEWYRPYRENVEMELFDLINHGEKVLHLAVHSFTPELNGEVRKADIGLLYDPKRSTEKAFCQTWLKQFKQQTPEYNVMRNSPYKGINDGFPTYLRTCFPESHYMGIELEINQKLIKPAKSWKKLQQQILETLQTFPE